MYVFFIFDDVSILLPQPLSHPMHLPLQSRLKAFCGSILFIISTRKLNSPREYHSPVNSTFHVNLTLIYHKLHCKRQIPFLAQKLNANKYKFHYNESILSLLYLFPESLKNMDIYGYN